MDNEEMQKQAEDVEQWFWNVNDNWNEYMEYCSDLENDPMNFSAEPTE